MKKVPFNTINIRVLPTLKKLPKQHPLYEESCSIVYDMQVAQINSNYTEQVAIQLMQYKLKLAALEN